MPVPWHKNHELLTSPARHYVGFADEITNQSGYLLEHPISLIVPELIIDTLEMVNIEHDQRQPAAVAQRALQFNRKQFCELEPVVSAGQRIGGGEIIFFLDQAFGNGEQLVEIL